MRGGGQCVHVGRRPAPPAADPGHATAARIVAGRFRGGVRHYPRTDRRRPFHRHRQRQRCRPRHRRPAGDGADPRSVRPRLGLRPARTGPLAQHRSTSPGTARRVTRHRLLRRGRNPGTGRAGPTARAAPDHGRLLVHAVAALLAADHRHASDRQRPVRRGVRAPRPAHHRPRPEGHPAPARLGHRHGRRLLAGSALPTPRR